MNRRVLLTALTGFVTSVLIGIGFIQLLVDLEVRNQLDSRLQQEAVAYRSVVRGLGQVARTLFDETINKPEVTALVKEVIESRGDQRDIARGLLFRELYPSYLRLKARGVRQLHFHTPDGLSMLRFHSPLKYGDSLFEVRESVRLANTELVPVEGFEAGKLFHGFRFVFPLFHEGQHIGSVESSVSFKTVEANLRALVPNELFEFVLNRDRVFSMLYPSERSIYESFRLNDEYVIEDVGAKLGQPRDIPALQQALEAALASEHGLIRSKMISGEAFGLTRKLEGRRYAALFMPVHSVSDQVDAYILTFTQVPDIESLYRNGLWIQLFFMALMASLSVGYYRRQTANQAIAAEREKLKAITERMAEGLFVQDTQGRITFLNEAAERILGISQSDATGLIAHDLFHVHYDDRGAPVSLDQCPIRSVTRKGEVYESEDEFFRRVSDQTLVPVQVTSARFSVANEENGSITIFRDITQRKTDEEQLRLAAIVFSHTVDGVVITGPDLHVLACNDAFVEITGYSRDEWLGQHIRRLRSGMHDEDFYRQMWAEINQDGFWEGEVWNRRKDGALYPQAQTISVVCNKAGQVTHYVSVMSDITERKQYEDELKRAREEALESAHAKSQFLANMSHEIRTPMNGMLGMLELLMDTELTPEQKDFLKIAQGSGKTLLSLLNSILDLSKYEAGRVELEQIDFGLRSILEDTVKLFAPQAQGKGLEIAVLLDSSVPEFVSGDPTRLRQVITNLLGNAIKFTDHGEVILSAKLEVSEPGALMLHIAIRDTGIGIPHEVQERIFESFSQADGSTTRKYGGTGLGLTLSREIVTHMGGKLWLESEPGKGSTFHFCVVLQPAQDPGSLFVPSEELQGLGALIVDDNATNRLILEHYCDSWKISHQSADSGEQALELLEQNWRQGKQLFDLVLTDMMMPDMDGVTLARQIRNDERFSTIKMILITSYTGRALNQQAEKAGFECLLAKPLGRDELHDAIERVLYSHNGISTDQASGSKTLQHELVGLRVLLAEDNDVNRMVALANLERLGCHAVSAENGREALEWVHRQRFDVVLMDCQMPVMDGLTATRELRVLEEQHGWSRLPVIAMTAFVTPVEIQRCLDAGMDGHLGKPFEPEQLRQILMEHARGVVSDISEPDSTALHEENGDNTTQVLSLDTLRQLEELLGGDIVMILEAFLEQLPDLVQGVIEGLETDKQELAYRAAHTLKSSAANVGGMSVSEQSAEIERNIKTLDKSELFSLAQRLSTESDKLACALQEFLKSCPHQE